MIHQTENSFGVCLVHCASACAGLFLAVLAAEMLGNSKKRKRAPRVNPDDFDMTTLNPKKKPALQTV